MAFKSKSKLNNIATFKNDSYYTLIDNPSIKHFFTKSNTPIKAFCAKLAKKKGGGICYSNNSITINSSSVNINDICSLSFGVSYEDVSSVGDF